MDTKWLEIVSRPEPATDQDILDMKAELNALSIEDLKVMFGDARFSDWIMKNRVAIFDLHKRLKHHGRP